MPLLSQVILGSVILSNFVLGVFVLKNNPKSATNRIFFLLAGSLSIWISSMYLSSLPPFSIWLTRSTLFFAVPMNVLFFLLAHTLPYSKLRLTKKKLITLLIVGLFVMLLTLSPHAFSEIIVQGNTHEAVAGPGMAIFGLFSILLNATAVYVLFKKFRKSQGTEHEQFRYVMYGILIMFGLIITTIFFPVVLFKNTAFVPFTPLYTALFLGMTAYAIIRHRLLDIRLILARAISFIIFTLFCAIIYILILFVGFQKVFHLEVDFFIGAVALLIALLAALTFQPILRWLRHITNKTFFKDNYDSNELLGKLTRIMAQSIDLQYMTITILDLLVKEMHLTKSAFLIVKNDKIINTASVNYQKKELISPKMQELFTKHLKLQPFIFEETREGKLKEIFRSFDISLSIPIKVDKVNIAVLILGPKLSGEIYNVQDINLLTIFSSQAGIAIQNAQSYEEIKKFSKELEKRVEERTHQLKDAQERELAKARDIARLKDEFVFIASHELRTPVTAIRGFLDLVSNAMKDYPKDIKENLGFMSAASEHLNQLINDLLEISRSEAGTLKVAVKPTPLVPIIQSIIQEVSTQANERQIQIKLTVTAKNDIAMIDDKKFKEVIMNVLSNAVKYNRDGGTIDINVSQSGNKMTVEVKDTGYGIPKNQQGKIFEKFFRATNERTGEVLGTGLGLFITRMLVEKMGGKITFTSEEGKGSNFKTVLPCNDKKA
jgi:signal transduction histidine kinase